MPKKKVPGPNRDKSNRKDETARKFPVVGLGASAGGLEALKAFFSKVEEKSGMAYIVVMHMMPKQPSMMPELLQKTTPVSVSAAKDGQAVAPDTVCIIPPGKDVTVYQGKIQLMDMIEKGISHPIDSFFRSLAQDLGPKAAAVILSGTGTDGSVGIKDIKGENGLILAQSEESAAYDGMPRCAINTGLVDMVLAPDEMPAKLVRYFHRAPEPPLASTVAVAAHDEREWLSKVFSILRAKTGHDFSAYKVNTVSSSNLLVVVSRCFLTNLNTA